MSNAYSLDSEAQQNLTPLKFVEYLVYKQRLIDDGETEDNIKEILTGWIWAEIEEAENAL